MSGRLSDSRKTVFQPLVGLLSYYRCFAVGTYGDYLDGRLQFAFEECDIVSERLREVGFGAAAGEVLVPARELHILRLHIAFKAEARRLLAQAEADAMAPLREQINELLQQVAKDMQLAFVLNTGSDACPYVNPAMSVDITDTLIDLLKKRR